MPRRLMGVLISGEAIAGLVCCGRKSIEVESEIPSDAQFFTAYFDYACNCFVAIFEHPSFDEVPEGCGIPFVRSMVSVDEEIHDRGRNYELEIAERKQLDAKMKAMGIPDFRAGIPKIEVGAIPDDRPKA